MNPYDWSTLGTIIDDGLAVRLTQSLLHFVWQGTALGGLAAAAGWILRHRSARLRYGIHVAALLLMLACLPVTFALVGPAAELAAQRSVGEPATESARVEAGLEPPETGEGPFGSAERAPSSVVGELPAAHDEGSRIAQPPSARAPVDTHQEPATLAPLATTLAPYTAGIYLLGVACMLLRLMLGVWGGHRLRRGASPVADPALLETVRRLARRMGMRAAPAVGWCGRVSVPIVAGVLQPMILLPSSLATGLNPSQLESLLTHELAHIRRYDLVVNIVQRLVEALLFFHPAVWFVSRRISTERENCCDDAVLASGCERIAYADALVRMAELCVAGGTAPSGQTAFLAASGGGATEFKRRILRVLGIESRAGLRLTRGALLVTLLVPAGLLAALATWQIRADSEPPSPAHSGGVVAGDRARDRDTAPPRVGQGTGADEQGSFAMANRVVDAQGRGIPGARLRIRYQGREVALFRADDQGRFEYPPNMPDDEELSAPHDPPVGGQFERLPQPPERRALYLEAWAPGFLKEQWVAPVDVRVRRNGALVPDVLRLHRPVTLAGRVLGMDGQPLAAVPLWLDHYSGRRTHSTLRRFQSDDAGRFELTGLPPGELFVRHGGATIVEPEEHPVPPSIRFAVAHVHADDGQTVENLTLDLRESNCAVTGELVDADGRGVAGASIRATWTFSDGRLGQHSVAAQTDERGQFQIDGLAGGEYRISASGPLGGGRHGGLGEPRAVTLSSERPVRVSLTAFTPGHAPPAKRAAAPRWGETHDGLQAAVVVEPRREQYAPGDVIDVRVLVRNVSREPKQFIDTFQFHVLQVTDSRGRYLRLPHPSNRLTGWPWSELYRLEPGHEVLLNGSFRMELRSAADTGTFPGPTVERGESYRLAVRFDDSVRHPGDPEGDEPRWVSGEVVLTMQPGRGGGAAAAISDDEQAESADPPAGDETSESQPSLRPVAPADQPVDAVTEQLFQQYVVRGGKIPSASVDAAIELVAARGTSPAFRQTVLAEFEKSCDDENSTVRRNLLKLISKLLAREGAERWRYERARRTGEVDQSAAATVTQRPSPENDKLMYRESELLARVIARGRQADRHDIDEFVIAVRQAHHPQGKRFLLDVLRNPLRNADDRPPAEPADRGRDVDARPAPVPAGDRPSSAAFDTIAAELLSEQLLSASEGAGQWPDNIGGSWYEAKFLAAVGLAELGEPAGVEWLLQQSERNDFGTGSMSVSLDRAPHARDARGNLRESCLLALADLFGLPPTDDSAPFQAWWAANKEQFAPQRVALRID